MEPRQQPDGRGQPPGSPPPGSPPIGLPPGGLPPGVPGQRGMPGAGPVPSTRRRRGRVRAVLAVLGGVVALLCLGGIGLGFVLYQEETKPDRSAPDVAVDNYLRALLVDRSEGRARIFECETGAELEAVQALKADLEAQEKRLDTTILVSWGELLVERRGQDAAAVTTAIRRTAQVDGASQSLLDNWRFEVVDRNGWRVCGGTRLA